MADNAADEIFDIPCNDGAAGGGGAAAGGEEGEDSPAQIAALKIVLGPDVLAADSEGYLTDSTLARYLRARQGHHEKSKKMLLGSLKWRAKTLADLQAAPGRQPSQLKDSICEFCARTPGYHPMRQVGFDKMRRPVVYVCFAQAQNYWFNTKDMIAHLVPLMENAVASMVTGVDQMVWVMDYNGFGAGSCNPMTGKTAATILADHYPERLGRVYCLNAPRVFSVFFSAISPFIDEKTKSKVIFPSSVETFRASDAAEEFGDEMLDWICEEVNENHKKRMSPAQKSFWLAPGEKEENGGGNIHDPRGCPSFVAEMIEPSMSGCIRGWQPHPNITLKSPPLPPS